MYKTHNILPSRSQLLPYWFFHSIELISMTKVINEIVDKFHILIEGVRLFCIII